MNSATPWGPSTSNKKNPTARAPACATRGRYEKRRVSASMLGWGTHCAASISPITARSRGVTSSTGVPQPVTI